jgi:hypothetical protein
MYIASLFFPQKKNVGIKKSSFFAWSGNFFTDWQYKNVLSIFSFAYFSLKRSQPGGRSVILRVGERSQPGGRSVTLRQGAEGDAHFATPSHTHSPRMRLWRRCSLFCQYQLTPHTRLLTHIPLLNLGCIFPAYCLLFCPSRPSGHIQPAGNPSSCSASSSGTQSAAQAACKRCPPPLRSNALLGSSRTL